MLKVDMSGLAPALGPVGDEIKVGDIMRTRQGKFYWIVSLPPEERRRGASDFYLYYFALDIEGQILRPGQCGAFAAQRDWVKIGHCDITVGEPEWFV